MTETGFSLGAVEWALLYAYIAAVASFVLVFASLACCNKSEVVVLTRLQVWNRLTVALVFVTLLIQAFYEADTNGAPHYVRWPAYGIARPCIALGLVPLMGFLLSHPVFRWLPILGMPLLVATDSLNYAELDLRRDCLTAGTCEANQGWSLTAVRAMQWRALVAIVLQVWVVLLAAFALVAQGACGNRYHPQLFSSSNPAPSLPGRKSWAAVNVLGVAPSLRKRRRKPAALTAPPAGEGGSGEGSDDGMPSPPAGMEVKASPVQRSPSPLRRLLQPGATGRSYRKEE